MPEQIKRMKTKTRVLNWTEWVGIALLIVFVISGAVVSQVRCGSFGCSGVLWIALNLFKDRHVFFFKGGF
jgi:hypothetical protein